MFLRITPRRLLARSGWASVADASDFGVPSRAQRNRSRRNRKGDPQGAPHAQVRHDGAVPGDDAADPDLLIDFAKVSLRRGGQVLVGPVTWAVELDERWVVIGPNGAGKTSLLRIAAAMEHPSSGTAYVLGERLGRVDMSELRARVGPEQLGAVAAGPRR